MNELEIFASNYPLKYVYKDDFSNGFEGWQYQYDTTGRSGITLTEEARLGTYGLLMHTKKAASAEAWARKGLVVPAGAKKIIKGCYWMFHGINANNPATLNFDFDYQLADGTNRYYYRVQYLNYSGGLQTKWRVNTGTATSQSFTDVTGGLMPIPWNESDKPMLNYIAVVINLETKKYETIYSNGTVYNVSAQSIGPAASAALTNFNGGAVDLYAAANRSDTSEECLFSIENTFLGYTF